MRQEPDNIIFLVNSNRCITSHTEHHSLKEKRCHQVKVWLVAFQEVSKTEKHPRAMNFYHVSSMAGG